MTKLLVSVRDVHEAALAYSGGADLIDVKEPSLGSLGAASPLVWKAIQEFARNARHRVAQEATKDSANREEKVRISVALGELIEPLASSRAQQVHGVDYAKLGLAGCVSMANWEAQWESTLACLKKDIKPVAVVYADHQIAQSPAPERVIELASSLGCVAVLFDTFDKTHGDLFAHLNQNRLAEYIAASQDKGMLVVLGGSLRQAGIRRAVELTPDYIAVRGAVCRESRSGVIDVDLVRLVASQVREFQSPQQANEISRRA